MASRVRLELEREEQESEANFVRALLDISREISRLRKLEETLQLIVDRTRELLDFDLVGVATLDDARGTTSWKAMSGFRTEAYKNVQFAPGRGTAGRAIARRQTVIIEGIGQRPEAPVEEFPIHAAEQVPNSIGVPLMIGERVVGVLIVGYRATNKSAEQRIRLAETVATQVTVAIENARLFTELSVANDRLVKADRLKTEMIAELSTPVIPIWDRILLAPVIGSLNAQRAQAMTNALLEKAAGSGADVVIIDITGVRTIDSDAAQHLHNTVGAVRVLGAECIVTGISASVAQTLVRLGIRLDDITTRRKLSDALQHAIDMIRMK
jgi:anti-anti-sigma regulatory factor/putative methionine-R-sulfoxide reductase with GAF domain